MLFLTSLAATASLLSLTEAIQLYKRTDVSDLVLFISFRD